jgi:hypothetical protein
MGMMEIALLLSPEALFPDAKSREIVGVKNSISRNAHEITVLSYMYLPPLRLIVSLYPQEILTKYRTILMFREESKHFFFDKRHILFPVLPSQEDYQILYWKP